MDTPEHQATASQQSTQNAFKVVDCDVHPYVKDGIKSVFPYMPEAWQQRFTRKRAVVGAYYSSDIGIHKEMEYKGNTILQEYAGTDVSPKTD